MIPTNLKCVFEVFCHGLYVDGALMEVTGIMEFHDHVGTFEGAFQTALYQVGRISGSFGKIILKIAQPPDLENITEKLRDYLVRST